MIYPKSGNRPVPPEVPSNLAEDFIEACVVLSDSPKASAALSRRCLQTLLREYAEVKKSDLSRVERDLVEVVFTKMNGRESK